MLAAILTLALARGAPAPWGNVPNLAELECAIHGFAVEFGSANVGVPSPLRIREFSGVRIHHLADRASPPTRLRPNRALFAPLWGFVHIARASACPVCSGNAPPMQPRKKNVGSGRHVVVLALLLALELHGQGVGFPLTTRPRLCPCRHPPPQVPAAAGALHDALNLGSCPGLPSREEVIDRAEKMTVKGFPVPHAGPFATTVYVATTGSDAAAGTQAAPFATLERARAAVSPAAKPALVIIAAGKYFINSTLQLGPKVSV